MKNVNVLLAVVLCAGLCVLFGLFNRSAEESLGWSPNDMYMQSILSSDGSSFTSANLSDGNVSNDGVAVSMRNSSFSLRTRVRHASSPSSLIASGAPAKSADFWGALSPNSPIANGVPGKSADFWGAFSPSSLIGHMTSSAEFHSFGGGSNMAMGSYTSSSNSLIASSPAIGSYSPSPIAYNPIASSPNNLIAYSPSNGEVQVAAEQALMSASSSASGLFGGMMTSYGTASYEDYYTSSPNRVNNRFNAPPGTSGEEGDDEGSAYLSWLEWLSKYGSAFGNQLGDENAWEFGDEESWNAFLAWYLATYNEQYDETGVVTPKITYDQWVSWFKTNGGSHYNDGFAFYFTPIGDIFPLLLMIFTYMVYVYLCRKGIAKFKQK